MARTDYPTLPAPWVRHGKGWRWSGASPADGGSISIQPTRRGWTARNDGGSIWATFAFEGPDGVQEWEAPTHFETPAQATAAAHTVWRLPRARIPNDGARAVAREYARILNIPKSEMRKITGKKFAKMQKSKRRALTPPQEQKLLALLPGYPKDVQAGILCMLTLGLRVAELATMQPDNTGVHVVGKGNKARHVLFNVDTRSRKAVLVAQQAGIATPSRLQAACRKMQKELPGLTPHVLRHTFATRAMQHGVDPKKLQAALGHGSFKTTLTYLSTIQS
jgi:integrase